MAGNNTKLSIKRKKWCRAWTSEAIRINQRDLLAPQAIKRKMRERETWYQSERDGRDQEKKTATMMMFVRHKMHRRLREFCG